MIFFSPFNRYLFYFFRHKNIKNILMIAKDEMEQKRGNQVALVIGIVLLGLIIALAILF